MVTILVTLAFLSHNSDLGTMPPAAYTAKSDLIDDKCAGGWSPSLNSSWTMKDVAVEAKGLSIVVKKNSCCGPGGSCSMIVILANGTPETVWLKASDSRLNLGREARDSAGVWRPIEYRAHTTCGNSFHRVALGSNRAWTWDIPATTGSFATKCRYVLSGLEKPVVSAEFDATIDPAIFSLPELWVNDFELKSDGSLVPKR